MFINTFRLDGLEDFSHRPVDLLDPVSIGTSSTGALEVLSGHEGKVYCSMGEIEKEWCLAVRFDKFHSFRGILRSNRSVFLYAIFNYGQVAYER